MANEMQRYRNDRLARPLPQRREPERVRVPDDERHEIIVVVQHNWLKTALAAVILFIIVFMFVLLTVISPWIERLAAGG